MCLYVCVCTLLVNFQQHHWIEFLLRNTNQGFAVITQLNQSGYVFEHAPCPISHYHHMLDMIGRNCMGHLYWPQDGMVTSSGEEELHSKGPEVSVGIVLVLDIDHIL